MTDPEKDELSAMVRAMLGGSFEDNVTAAFYPESAYPLGIPLNDTKVTKLVWEVVTNNTDVSAAQIAVYGQTNSSVTPDLELAWTTGTVFLAVMWKLTGFFQP